MLNGSELKSLLQKAEKEIGIKARARRGLLLGLQLRHHSPSPVRLSIIHFRDLRDSADGFACIDGKILLFTVGV